MSGRRITQTENGFQVWRDNALIATLDIETDTLKTFRNGVWFTVGTCYNRNDIFTMLDEFMVRPS